MYAKAFNLLFYIYIDIYLFVLSLVNFIILFCL